MASDIRARLQKNAAQLKAGGHDASAIEAILEPGGWTLLRSAQGTEGGSTDNLALNIPEPLRDKLRKAAEAKDTTLGTVASDGLRKVAAGEWAPPVPVRAPRGSLKAGGVKRVTLNVWVETEPRQQVEAMLPDLTKEAGRRITLSHTVLSWLREELGVTDD
ncbi:hypothetical protein [Streptomyces sp. Da 82-17]|uniref:hypothetical protein n=1 Tax=Streptomyces sp. Da 82-17 TaxID=3377116 RepID=UPI0038D3BBF9